jgi:hypothetical protein
MTRQQNATTDLIGVAHDSDAYARTDDAYRRIDAGEWDDQLDQLERAIDARKRARSFPRMEPWSGDAPVSPVDRVAVGYYDDQGRGMGLLAEAIRNRRTVAKRERLQANPPTLRVDDRVRVHPDAPVKTSGKGLLGKPGTVTNVLRERVDVRMDPDPAIPTKMLSIRVHPWMLEKIVDPAAVTIVTPNNRPAGADRDPAGRVRVRYGSRRGWAALNITWDDEAR